MKKALSFLIISLFIASAATASEGNFTKDPTCPGGLYLWGPGEGFTSNLYYSDDFGETLDIMVPDAYYEGGLISDATPGYLLNHYGIIWLSQNYGVIWDPVGSALYNISTGRYPGEMYTFDYILYEFVIKYSINYGSHWDIHYPIGLPENSMIHTIGKLEGEFYTLDVEEGGLYRSINFADDFIYISTLPVNGSGYGTRITHGALPGELYFYDGHTGDLFFSADTGYTFEWTHNFPDTSNYITQMQAGTTTGEVFISMMDGYYTGGGEIYIYYSDDYGYNFIEFHPFSTTVRLPYVNLTPLGTTSFPATGGILEYNIECRNLGPIPYTGDVWCDVTLPDSSTFGPVLGPVQDLYFGYYWTGNRDRELTVPANAPAGSYTLNAYIGEYDPINPTIDAEDHLVFEKTDSGESIGNEKWFVDSGDMFGSDRDSHIASMGISLLETYPNPFNPATIINFDLLTACWVTVDVFDINGRNVGARRASPLHNARLDAGTHHITFDGSGLPSGIYIYRLQAGDFIASGKMILMK